MSPLPFMPAKWLNRFELKPGRWVYVPAPEARASGIAIKAGCERLWSPPDYFYHLQSGGHVAALRSHIGSNIFFKADIQNFFGSINRTRVTRCLKSKFSYRVAREWAVASTVQDPGRKSTTLPYGFVQSQLLASLCLFESALGKVLHRINGQNGTAVSIYVDDIIVSTRDAALLEKLYGDVVLAADRSRFILNPAKSTAPSPQISAFNILMSEAQMSIEPTRLSAFASALALGATPSQRQGILGYVNSVCPAQLSAL